MMRGRNRVQKTSTRSVTVLFNTAPTLNQYVVSLKGTPWLNKYCLKEILKHNILWISAGFVAISAKAAVFIVVLNQG
jgi:hypothetical protein